MAKPQKGLDGLPSKGKDYTDKTYSVTTTGWTPPDGEIAGFYSWGLVTPGQIATSKGNDFLYVTVGSGGDLVLNTGPTFDGGAQPSGGADQILLKTDNLTVNDGFFEYLQNMEVLKLADDLDANGVGTTVTLGINALATGIKEVTGGSGSDIITFTSGYDTTAVKVDGGAGNDGITTAGGNDTIYGGAGDDTMTGGAGADRFVFEATAAANGADTITDFVGGSAVADTNSGDRLDLGAFETAGAVVSVTGSLTAATGTVYCLVGQATGAADSAGGVATALTDAAVWAVNGGTATTAWVVVSDDNSAAIYQWVDVASSDNEVSAAELTLVATITGTVALGDILIA